MAAPAQFQCVRTPYAPGDVPRHVAAFLHEAKAMLCDSVPFFVAPSAWPALSYAITHSRDSITFFEGGYIDLQAGQITDASTGDDDRRLPWGQVPLQIVIWVKAGIPLSTLRERGAWNAHLRRQYDAIFGARFNVSINYCESHLGGDLADLTLSLYPIPH